MKEGAFVRILNNNDGGQFPIGSIQRVADVQEASHSIMVESVTHREYWFYSPDALEIVEPSKPFFNIREDYGHS